MGEQGWAYHLLEQGYVVYMVDYPARGRSAYVPLPGPDGKTPIDGNLNIRTGARARADLDQRTRARRLPAEDEPHAMAGQRQDRRSDLRQLHEDAGAVRCRDGSAAVPAGIALARHDRLAGDPADALAGWRLRLRDHRGAPRAREGYRGRSSLEARSSGTSTRPRSLQARATPIPGGSRMHDIEFDPPANAPGDLNVVLEEKSGAARRSALLDAGGAGAQARQLEEHPRARSLGQRHLSPRRTIRASPSSSIRRV